MMTAAVMRLGVSGGSIRGLIVSSCDLFFVGV